MVIIYLTNEDTEAIFFFFLYLASKRQFSVKVSHCDRLQYMYFVLIIIIIIIIIIIVIMIFLHFLYSTLNNLFLITKCKTKKNKLRELTGKILKCHTDFFKILSLFGSDLIRMHALFTLTKWTKIMTKRPNNHLANVKWKKQVSYIYCVDTSSLYQ